MIKVTREYKDKNTKKLVRAGAILSNETVEREKELISKGYAVKIEKTEQDDIIEETNEEEVVEEIVEKKPKATKKKVVD